jgi:2'-5' RNA ligase
MTTLRAFVAVPIPEDARRALVSVVASLRETVRGRGLRWVRPEAYHVTLCFLGEIEAVQVAALRPALGAALTGQLGFTVEIGGLRLFPSPRRPKVIAVDLEPEAPFAALAARVDEAVRGTGLSLEARRFRAHLTLARLRDRVHPSLPEGPVAASPFPVTEVVLYRSELRPDGARYTALERLTLGGPVLANPESRIQPGEVNDEERPNP